MNFIPTMKRKYKQKKENNKQTVDDLHHVTCFDLQTVSPTATATFQTVVIKANTSLTVVLFVTVRWKHWVMFTVIYGMG